MATTENLIPEIDWRAYDAERQRICEIKRRCRLADDPTRESAYALAYLGGTGRNRPNLAAVRRLLRQMHRDFAQVCEEVRRQIDAGKHPDLELVMVYQPYPFVFNHGVAGGGFWRLVRALEPEQPDRPPSHIVAYLELLASLTKAWYETIDELYQQPTIAADDERRHRARHICLALFESKNW